MDTFGKPAQFTYTNELNVNLSGMLTNGQNFNSTTQYISLKSTVEDCKPTIKVELRNDKVFVCPIGSSNNESVDYQNKNEIINKQEKVAIKEEYCQDYNNKYNNAKCFQDMKNEHETFTHILIKEGSTKVDGIHEEGGSFYAVASKNAEGTFCNSPTTATKHELILKNEQPSNIDKQAETFCQNAGTTETAINLYELSTYNYTNCNINNTSPSTATPSKPFKCDKCDRSFTRKSDLKKHDLIHTGYKPFKCEKCAMCFNRKHDLKRHGISHSDYKLLNLYKCDKCNKTFSRKGDLMKHDRIHTGFKPFKCEHCEKCFHRGDDLKKHTISHSGSKEFKCDRCGKSFGLKENLRKHAYIHSGYKPFKCDKCDKSFSRNVDLKNHYKTHAKGIDVSRFVETVYPDNCAE